MGGRQTSDYAPPPGMFILVENRKYSVSLNETTQILSRKPVSRTEHGGRGVHRGSEPKECASCSLT